MYASPLTTKSTRLTHIERSIIVSLLQLKDLFARHARTTRYVDAHSAHVD